MVMNMKKYQGFSKPIELIEITEEEVECVKLCMIGERVNKINIREWGTNIICIKKG